VVICLEQDADLHMAQLKPLPLTVSCFSKIQIGFSFLVLTHPGSPGQRAIKRVCVERVCVYVYCQLSEETGDECHVSAAESVRSGERVSSLEMELETLREHCRATEDENLRLKSEIEGLRSDNELLQQKVSASRTAAARLKSAEMTRRQQRSTFQHSYKRPVTTNVAIASVPQNYNKWHYKIFFLNCSQRFGDFKP